MSRWESPTSVWQPTLINFEPVQILTKVKESLACLVLNSHRFTSSLIENVDGIYRLSINSHPLSFSLLSSNLVLTHNQTTYHVMSNSVNQDFKIILVLFIVTMAFLKCPGERERFFISARIRNISWRHMHHFDRDTCNSFRPEARVNMKVMQLCTIISQGNWLFDVKERLIGYLFVGF